MVRSMSRFSTGCLLVALTLVQSACVENALRESRKPFDYGRAELPKPPGPGPGAIWPGETPSGSFLYYDSKARGVGDLVTVRIVESFLAEGSAETDLESKSEIGANLTSDVGFQEFVSQPIRTLLRAIGIDDPGRDVAAGSTLNVLESQNEQKFEGDGSTNRKGRFEAIVTCRVVDVLPGGVFHVRGRRAITVNHEVQYLTLEGLVRREDIGLDNSVASIKLADARLSYDGLGVIDDKQRPGVVARVLSWVYPF